MVEFNLKTGSIVMMALLLVFLAVKCKDMNKQLNNIGNSVQETYNPYGTHSQYNQYPSVQQGYQSQRVTDPSQMFGQTRSDQNHQVPITREAAMNAKLEKAKAASKAARAEMRSKAMKSMGGNAMNQGGHHAIADERERSVFAPQQQQQQPSNMFAPQNMAGEMGDDMDSFFDKFEKRRK